MNPIPVPDEVRAAYPDSEVRDFGPPPGVDQEECGTAQIVVAPYEMGGTAVLAFHAYFRPNAEQLEALNAGGLIEVSQIGHVLQPFAAHVLTVTDAGPNFHPDAVVDAASPNESGAEA